MNDKALLFIPDISGFTKFITETEINHSRHIISELISVIINSNSLDLNISEIEGDAVFFYKFGNPPDLSAVLEQCKKMFIDFHSYLKALERDNVCQCGACTSTNKLTLKFITHFGEIREVQIQNFKKLIGGDVILIHRLLKNSVPHNEYLLLTENYLNSLNGLDIKDEWITFNDIFEEIENFGKVKAKYVILSPLREYIKIPGKNLIANTLLKTAEFSEIINAPMLSVHKELINIENKKFWTVGLKSVSGNTKLNRINATHTCAFENMKLLITTINNFKAKDEISYTEKVEVSQDLILVFEYFLKNSNSSTKLNLRISRIKTEDHFNNTVEGFIKKIKRKFFLGMMLKNMKRNLKNFKIFCEEKYSGESY